MIRSLSTLTLAETERDHTPALWFTVGILSLCSPAYVLNLNLSDGGRCRDSTVIRSVPSAFVSESETLRMVDGD